MLRTTVTSLGLFALGAIGVTATAQQAGQAEPVEPAPQAQVQVPTAIEQALGGFHVAVLKNAEGGVVTVQNQQGDNAVVAFLEPAAAEEAQENAAIADLTVSALPLLSMLASWNGPVVFEGSTSAIGHASTLQPEVEAFGAPVFFVLADGNETQVDAGTGPITPILLSFEDASEMASQITEQGVEAEKIEIVPIEFGAVLKELSVMEQDQGYRVFTHPDTVSLIQAARASEEETSQR